MEKLHKEILKLGARRLVIDSLTPIIDILDRGRYRSFLRTSLIPALKKLGVTSLVITERMPSNIPHVYGEYLFDGLIELSIEEKSRLIYRWLEVKKIRGVKIPSAKIPIAIVDGKGIVFLYPETEVQKLVAQEVVSAGIPELDSMLGGGLRSGTSTLLKGPLGSGKQNIMLHMASEALKHGKKVLMVELLGNPEGLRHRLKRIIDQRGIRPKGDFKVIRFNFDKDSLFDSLAETTPYLVEEGYDYIIINGLEVIDKVLQEDYAWLVINSIIRSLRNLGKVMVATYSTTTVEFTEHEDLFDNVIMLRLKMESSKVKRFLAVTKTHTGVLGEKIWELTFDKGKIFLKEVGHTDEKREE